MPHKVKMAAHWIQGQVADRGGGWKPGGFVWLITLIVHLALLALMMNVRGMDYASGESPTASHRLGAVESAAPLWVWGLAFTTTACLGLVALAWRWAGGVIASHTVATGLYAAVGVGIVIDVMGRTDETGGKLSWVLVIPALALVATAVGAWRKRGFSLVVVAATAVSIVLGLMTIDLDGLRNATILFGVAVMHAAMAAGTAQVAAQERIRRELERGEL